MVTGYASCDHLLCHASWIVISRIGDVSQASSCPAGCGGAALALPLVHGSLVVLQKGMKQCLL